MTTTTKARICFVDFEGPDEIASGIVRALAAQLGSPHSNSHASTNGNGKMAAVEAAVNEKPTATPALSAPKKRGKYKKRTKGEEAPAAKASRSLSVGDIDDAAFKVGIYLKDNGRTRSDGIRRGVGIDADTLEAVLARPWFEKAGGCWTLSSDGNAHFQRDDDEGD